jgi:D-alanine-D-alanine ligase
MRGSGINNFTKKFAWKVNMNKRHLTIGLTYDLRDQYLAEGYSELETAEFDRADTIDELENAIRRLGHKTDRIGNAKELLHRLAAGDRWDLVFNICEGLRGIGREAQVPAMLDLYDIPYTFADACVMSVCLDKAMTKCVVANAGVPTPRHAVVRDSTEVAKLRETNQLLFPLFAKPIAEGTGKGVTPASVVNNLDELTQICTDLLLEFHQPVLVEEFLPGREFTVGLIGTGRESYSLGTLEIILLENAEAGVYSYVNKENCEELVKYVQVSAMEDDQVRRSEEIALAAWRILGCRDGGRVDIRCDANGNPQFIEANPLAGLHPCHSDLPMLATALGIPYVELIRRIVDSAAKRCGARTLHHHFDSANHKNGIATALSQTQSFGVSAR